jgi:hypothetical protein
LLSDGAVFYDRKVMHEVTYGDDRQREKLISLLQADFISPEKQAVAERAAVGGSALGSLLANACVSEDIDARLASDENTEIGQAVERFLEPAPVTRSFKEFIAGEVRRAHAWETKVDEIVSPGRLGLINGDGIFDPAKAKDLEAQALRGRMFDVMHRYTNALTIEGEDETVPPHLFLTGAGRPSDYKAAVDVLDEWGHDYQNSYDEDPFEGLDHKAFMDAGGRVAVPKDWAMAKLIKHLRKAQELDEE